MPKIIKILIPVIAAGAGVAYALAKKKETDVKSPAADKAEEKEYVPINPKEGTYSFMSGYSDANHVELTVTYDAETTSFNVVEEEYLCYSSDSHVALMSNEDFNLQLEYAEFFAGEDYDSFKAGLQEKYKSFKDVNLKCAEACAYIAGDALCYCIPTAQSYVLVSVIPAKGSKETTETLGSNAALKAILNSVTVDIIS